MTTSLPPELPPTKRRHGCLFWGAIIAGALLLVFGIGGYFAFRYMVGWIVDTVEHYSEPAPRPVPPQKLDPAAYPALEQRIHAFSAALDKGEATEPLVLTGEELDAWARHQNWLTPPSQVALDIVGDHITADLSLQLDEFLPNLSAVKKLEGRYLNAHAMLDFTFVNSLIDVEFQSIEVKGEPLPEEFRKAVNGQDVLAAVRRRTELRRTETHIRTIVVADGKITITGKH